jgi:hypothetical protein
MVLAQEKEPSEVIHTADVYLKKQISLRSLVVAEGESYTIATLAL